MWEQALQGVVPITGGQALPPATYRFRVVGGEGKLNSNKAVMLSLQLEVASGPLAGRKAFHNENLPKGDSDSDKTRMGFFLGLMDAFGITGVQLGQMFAGRGIDVETVDYLAKALVQTGRLVKGTAVPQRDDASRINLKGWVADDGMEPEPPKQVSAAPSTPAGPGFPGGIPGGVPGAPGFPGGAPQGQGGFPPAGPPQGAPGGMPLGGFTGSGGMQPNAAPDWANQPAAQQAPPAQQFQQPQAAPVPQPQQGGFPGQQFPGQVNPAQFPAQGQPQQFGGPVQGFQGQPDQAGQFAQQAQPAMQPQQPVQGQMPGMPAQQAQNPNGLPQGGFPNVGGNPPQASF
jgi:hypothetical protein